jgi:hypothetical protein
MLNVLIKQAEDQEAQSKSSSKKKGKPKKGQGQGEGEGEGQGAGQGRSQGQEGGSGGGGNQGVEDNSVARMVRKGPQSPWSKVRDKERDPVFGAIKEKFPARYQSLLEQYYESFSSDEE